MAKSPFKVRTEGSFKNFLMFLKRLENGEFYKIQLFPIYWYITSFKKYYEVSKLKI